MMQWHKNYEYSAWTFCLGVALLMLSGCGLIDPAIGDEAPIAKPIVQVAAVDSPDEDQPTEKDAKPKKELGENPFPGKKPAPSLEGGVEWLNTSGEITNKDLRGKVVLLDFWCYCCINCMHILPDLKYLEKKFPNQLVVIGVHVPKFTNEHESENIRRAIVRYEIEHPVVNDAKMIIGRKFGFSSWPTYVLIDPEGNYVGYRSGEGQRELFEGVISQMVEYHRAKGTLDESPVRFDLERQKAEPTPLKFPGKIVADEAGGRLFVSDSNHNRVIISSLEGKLLDVVGNGQIGAKDGGYAEAMFDHPQGMCLVGQTLYVADTENHLLRTIDLQRKTVATLAGTGQQGHRDAGNGSLRKTALNSPWDLLHLKGTLYIAMAGPHQLWQHKLGTDSIGVFAGSGLEDIMDGSYTRSACAQPSGITTDGTHLYHVDSEGSAVRQTTLSKEGDLTTLVGPHDIPHGRSLFEFGDIDGVGDGARLQHPLGILYHDGALFVADTYNHKIKRITRSEKGEWKSTTWLGRGNRGNSLSPVELAEPAGMTFAKGSLFVADTNNHRILTVDLTSQKTAEFVIDGLTPPQPPVEVETALVDASVPVTLVPAATAAIGKDWTIEISFKLGKGFKLNPLSEVAYQVQMQGAVIDPQFVAVSRHSVKGVGHEVTLKIPAAKAAAEGSVELSLVYPYCREGAQGICRVGRQRWKIPLKLGDQVGEPLSLTATAGE